MPRMYFEHGLSSLWLEAVLDSASDGIVIEAAERVVYANDAYARLLGYRRACELITRSIADLITAEDAERLTRYGRIRAAGQHAPESYAFSALRRDGASLPLQASVSFTMLGKTPYIMTIVRPSASAAATRRDESLPGAHDALSARERQVMEMLLAGKRAKVIAAELGVNDNTVATHRARLFQKIGISDTRELFRYALRHRLVDWS